MSDARGRELRQRLKKKKGAPSALHRNAGTGSSLVRKNSATKLQAQVRGMQVRQRVKRGKSKSNYVVQTKTSRRHHGTDKAGDIDDDPEIVAARERVKVQAHRTMVRASRRSAARVQTLITGTGARALPPRGPVDFCRPTDVPALHVFNFAPDTLPLRPQLWICHEGGAASSSGARSERTRGQQWRGEQR